VWGQGGRAGGDARAQERGVSSEEDCATGSMSRRIELYGPHRPLPQRNGHIGRGGVQGLCEVLRSDWATQAPAA